MRDKVDLKVMTAILDLKGAHCGACVYAIEHAGRKVAGVSDVYVDVSTNEARVVYNGNDDALQKIAGLVRSLGYDAVVRSESGPTEARS